MKNNNATKVRVDELINEVVSANQSMNLRKGANFSSALFVGKNIDEINSAVKDCFADKNMNVVVVTANGYEIPFARAAVDISENVHVFSVICPGDERTDELKKTNTVLFLPNIENMCDLVYRRLLLDMARTHIVADPRNGEGGFAMLDGSFFAVATIEEMDMRDFRTLTSLDAKDSFFILNFAEKEA